MRPTIKRTATGAIELTTNVQTYTLTRDDAVMLAHELAGCVEGLTVVVAGPAIDVTLHPEIPHRAGWTRVVDALPNPKARIDVMYYDGMTEREGASLYDWPGEGVYRKTHWRYV